MNSACFSDWRARIAIALFVSYLCLLPTWALEVKFWVWHRTAPLNEKETRSLTAQGVKMVYWHAATMRAEGEGWRVSGQVQLPRVRETALAIVPVLRLDAGGAMPLGVRAAESVAAVMMEAMRRTGAEEAQIDFDCPDRRLNEYAAFLAQCRARIAPARLSVTALAGWSRLPAFEKIQASADALMPMFYDLEPDLPGEVRAGRVLPLLDASRLADQLQSWRSCRIPWFAGLPNFARVTVFDREGRSRGHLREWEWDAITFNPSLVPERTHREPGVTLLRAEKSTTVARTPIHENETVACRLTDLAHLGQAIGYARSAGAAGVTFFRLPGEGSQGGWSLIQFETLLRERSLSSPVFKVRRTRNGLELLNVSGSDLPPRLAGMAGPHDRGWQLEVESSEGAVFREANPGEFANVFAHAEPDSSEPKLVPIPTAQRLTYWFADLRAGASRQTGLLQLAPGTGPTSLRWRIVGSDHNSKWQPVE